MTHIHKYSRFSGYNITVSRLYKGVGLKYFQHLHVTFFSSCKCVCVASLYNNFKKFRNGLGWQASECHSL